MGNDRSGTVTGPNRLVRILTDIDAIGYGLIAALIAVMAIAAMQGLGGQSNSKSLAKPAQAIGVKFTPMGNTAVEAILPQALRAFQARKTMLESPLSQASDAADRELRVAAATQCLGHDNEVLCQFDLVERAQAQAAQ